MLKQLNISAVLPCCFHSTFLRLLFHATATYMCMRLSVRGKLAEHASGNNFLPRWTDVGLVSVICLLQRFWWIVFVEISGLYKIKLIGLDY